MASLVCSFHWRKLTFKIGFGHLLQWIICKGDLSDQLWKFVFHFIENHHKNKCALIYYGRNGLGVPWEIFNVEATCKYTQMKKPRNVRAECLFISVTLGRVYYEIAWKLKVLWRWSKVLIWSKQILTRTLVGSPSYSSLVWVDKKIWRLIGWDGTVVTQCGDDICV